VSGGVEYLEIGDYLLIAEAVLRITNATDLP
jgi:hypothetical protein